MTQTDMLSRETIEELRQIILEDYGREVSEKEASEIAHAMVGYYDTLAKIYHEEKNNNNNEQNEHRGI